MEHILDFFFFSQTKEKKYFCFDWVKNSSHYGLCHKRRNFCKKGGFFFKTFSFFVWAKNQPFHRRRLLVLDFKCEFASTSMLNFYPGKIVLENRLNPNQPASVLYCRTVYLSNEVNCWADKHCKRHQAKVGINWELRNKHQLLQRIASGTFFTNLQKYKDIDIEYWIFLGLIIRLTSTIHACIVSIFEVITFLLNLKCYQRICFVNALSRT